MKDINGLSREPYKSMWVEGGILYADFNTEYLDSRQVTGGRWDCGVGETSWGVYAFDDAVFRIVTATHYVDWDGEIMQDEEVIRHCIVRSDDGLWRRLPTYNFELDDRAIAPLFDAEDEGKQIAVKYENNGSGRVVGFLIDGEDFPKKEIK